MADIWDRAVAGRVLTVFCNDVSLARLQLRSFAEEQERVPTLVALEWEFAPSLTRELDEIRDALADAALALWPSWFVTAEDRFRRRRRTEASVDGAVEVGTRATVGVSASWVRSVWQQCAKGRLPIFPGMATSEQVHQLALALDPSRLVFAISVRQESASPSRIRGLAKAAEWLASETKARTFLLAPQSWQASGELDHVNYDAVLWDPEETFFAKAEGVVSVPVLPPASSPSEPPVASDVLDRFQVNVGPIVGKPHPGSEVEQALFARIMKDRELAPLFEFNQRLKAFGNKHFIVDLVWRAGGLIVELDGTSHHSQMAQIKDKERDYRLLMSGYVTLRIPNAEMYVDDGRVLTKIRNVVKRLKKHSKDKQRDDIQTQS